VKIYTFWNATPTALPEQAQLLRHWARSWKRQGWEPRILTEVNSRKSPHYSPSSNPFDLTFFALHAVGGGWFSLPTVMNISLTPFKPKEPVLVKPWCLVWLGPKKWLGEKEIDCRRFSPGVLRSLRYFSNMQDLLNSEVCH
jgi:hypothetical protein